MSSPGPAVAAAPPVESPPSLPIFKLVKSPVRTRDQGVQVIQHIYQHLLLALILFVVWLVGYYRFSLAWILILLLLYLAFVEYNTLKTSHTPTKPAAVVSKIDELPAWVRH